MQKGDHKYPYISRHWEFAGGKIEQGESPEEALRRELMEEMDYPVEVVRHLITVEHTYPDFEIRLMAYLCHPAEKDKPSSYTLREHLQAAWLLPSQLSSLEWAEADHEIITHIERAFGGSPDKS